MSTYRNMFAMCAGVLCFLAVSQSARLPCEDLLRPLDQLDYKSLEGKWAEVAAGFPDPGLQSFARFIESFSMDFSTAGGASNMNCIQKIHIHGKCETNSYPTTLVGSTLTYDARDEVNPTDTLIHAPCPDCLVMRRDIYTLGTVLSLFSRRRQLESTEMLEFRHQLECLNMLPPFLRDPAKELCAD